MRITSEARREAARRNGAKSRGPVSARGKAISSRNNLRHGFRSKFIDVAAPEPAEWEQLYAEHRAEVPPRSAREDCLLREFAGVTARLQRIHSLYWTCENNRAAAGLLDRDYARTSRRLDQVTAALSDLQNKFFRAFEPHKPLKTIKSKSPEC